MIEHKFVDAIFYRRGRATGTIWSGDRWPKEGEAMQLTTFGSVVRFSAKNGLYDGDYRVWKKGKLMQHNIYKNGKLVEKIK
jgi:hypothetical protein